MKQIEKVVKIGKILPFTTLVVASLLLPPLLIRYPSTASADLLSGQHLSLTSNSGDYTIENDYYIAVVHRAVSGNATGIIKHLYIRKSDQTLSDDLVYQGSTYYGLGYLEGANPASSGQNSSFGLQNSVATTVSLTESTATRIKITATYNNGAGGSFSEVWTFWAGKPYFQSEASITGTTTYQTNQFQFCWMVNSALPISWYGTDENGDIDHYTTREMQQIHSPNLDTYPWINWQFTGETVSLGLVFTDINTKYTTVGETGDMPFEYQLDFQLGGGSAGNPVKSGTQRAATTLYYTADSATNSAIQDFATNYYQNAATTSTTEPSLLAAASATDAYGQNSGKSSTLLNSPYFLVRQNAQNRPTGIEWPQYATSIFAPLYKYQSVIHSGSVDFIDQLKYTLNYDNDSTTYTYGTINTVNVSNSSTDASIEHVAASSDGKLAYNSLFQAWSDSDKLQITGTTANGDSSADVKDIYMSLTPSNGYSYEAETATPSASITSNLVTNDNLWTNYTGYSFDSGTTLIYRDNAENVPTVDIPIDVIDGTYAVTAYVNQRIEGSITYQYSTDNSNWDSFIVPIGDANGSYSVSLGLMNLNGNFYINDDDNASTGIAGYAGWDRIVITPAFTDLGSNVYDLRLSDPIYGTVGVAVKVNFPTDNIVNGTDLRIHMYKQASAQTLTTFSYPFDVEIYPHSGSLDAADDFTDLHSQSVISYLKHNFYLPLGLHSGRTNTVYPDGTITYSTDPYNDSDAIDMTVTPSGGDVDISITNWETSGNYTREWTESSVTHSTTTDHVVGNLVANTSYDVLVDDVKQVSTTSDSSGYISFTYSGGYSAKTFKIVKTPAEAPPAGSGGDDSGSTKTIETVSSAKTSVSTTPSTTDTTSTTAPPATPEPTPITNTTEQMPSPTIKTKRSLLLPWLIIIASASAGLLIIAYRLLALRHRKESGNYPSE